LWQPGRSEGSWVTSRRSTDSRINDSLNGEERSTPMNNQVKGLIYYYGQNLKYNSKIFWTILIATTLATGILANFLMDVEGSQFYWAFPIATYTNVCIIAFQSVKKDIPFGLKMGATRKNIFLSYLYFFFSYSLFMALASSTVQWIFEGL